MILKRKLTIVAFQIRLYYFQKVIKYKFFRTFKIQHPRCVFQIPDWKIAAPTPDMHVSFRQK